MVRIPSSWRTGATCRIAGWCARREHEAETELVDRLGDPAPGGCSSRIPSASSTSAEPAAELAARFPCFATAAPAAAATSAAAVEMLNVCGAVAAGADDVDDVRSLGRDRDDVLAHRLGEPGDLVGRLALRPQGDEEAGDLGRASPRRP